MESVRLANMSWTDAKEAFSKRKLALVPTGSTEQHGGAMPLGTDWMIAERLADMAGESLPESIVTPVIPIGNAFYHSDFPGTLAVTPETLTLYVKEFCQYLVKYGITHILFVNGHGGNTRSLEDVGYSFRDLGVPVATINWWEMTKYLNPEWGLIGHGDIFELSLVLAISPGIVNMSQAKIPANKRLGNIELLDIHNGRFEDGMVHLSLRTSDVTDSGDFIEYGSDGTDYSVSPAGATPELGERILAAVADYIVRFAKEFQKIKFDPVK